MPELPPRHARPLVGVFVGGRSRRMGRDKATIRVGPETLLARTVRVAARVGDVVLVGGDDETPTPLTNAA
ncbi:MAG: NTP transferase domain-containing protein, partial [Myxococcota bacterium]